MTHKDRLEPHEVFENRMNEVAEQIGKGTHFTDSGVILVARGLLAVAKEIYELRVVLTQTPIRR